MHVCTFLQAYLQYVHSYDTIFCGSANCHGFRYWPCQRIKLWIVLAESYYSCLKKTEQGMGGGANAPMVKTVELNFEKLKTKM